VASEISRIRDDRLRRLDARDRPLLWIVAVALVADPTKERR